MIMMFEFDVTIVSRTIDFSAIGILWAYLAVKYVTFGVFLLKVSGNHSIHHQYS